MVLTLILVLTSCGENGQKKLDMDTVYSDITNKCQLQINYENKTFLKDGIEVVKLSFVNDGDTAGFRLGNGEIIRVRFYGIDTAESTSQVEKWGKAASIFTKGTLEGAYECLLESSTGGAAVTDSYGERYLGYVWYRNSSTDSWKNLNLQLVENGYTKNSLTGVDKYYNSFFDAAYFAKNGLLRIWGNSEDQYYTTDPIEVTIQELVEGIDLYYNAETDSGAKVMLVATVIDLEIYESGTYNYVIGVLKDGKEYTFPIYGGYASSSVNSYIQVGNTYRITGNIQKYYENFQISGLAYVAGFDKPEYVSLKEKSTYLIFDSEHKFYSNMKTNLKTDASVVDAKLEGTTLTMTVNAYARTSATAQDSKVSTYNIIVEVGANFDVNTVLNKTMSGGVYKIEGSSNYQALSINELTFK